MSFKKIFSIIFVLIFCMQSAIIFSMDIDDLPDVLENIEILNPVKKIQQSEQEQESTLTPEEREEILANAREVINSLQDINVNPQQIIDDYNRDKQARFNQADQEETNKLQWQNTILLGRPDGFIAVYNKDLVTASTLAVNLSAIYMFNKQLHEFRISQIHASLIDDPEKWITLLEEVKEEKSKLDLEWLEKNVLSKIASKFKKSAYVKRQELEALVEEEHNVIGYNPFKQELIKSLAGIFIAQKVTSYAENQFLAKNVWKDAAFSAFTKDNNDNVQQHQAYVFPVSVTSFVKWWFFPGLATEWRDIMPDIQKVYPDLAIGDYWEEFLEDKGLLKLYNILHSPIVHFIIQIGSLGLGAKMMNDVYQARWFNHMLEKQDQLIELLYAYKDVKTLSEKSSQKESIANELKAFVIEGNCMTTLSGLGTWSLLKDKAFSKIAFYRSLPIWGCIAWHCRNEIAGFCHGILNRNAQAA